MIYLMIFIENLKLIKFPITVKKLVRKMKVSSIFRVSMSALELGSYSQEKEDL